MTEFPESLVRFRGELEAAVGREQRRRGRVRRRVLRVAVVGAGAAAVAVGAFAALPGDPAGRLVEPASAAERAAEALEAAPGSVVHVETLVEQRGADGSRTTWRVESWQQTAPPYEVREVVTPGTGTPPGGGTPAPATAQPFRDQVVELLRGGKLTESGRSTVGGRETVSFAWDDGRARYEYTVEAGTYEPVRWRLSPTDEGGETIVTFETYELLPADGTP